MLSRSSKYTEVELNGFWMVTFLAVLLMAYTFHNLGLLESTIMLRTLCY